MVLLMEEGERVVLQRREECWVKRKIDPLQSTSLAIHYLGMCVHMRAYAYTHTHTHKLSLSLRLRPFQKSNYLVQNRKQAYLLSL